jgi:phosphatidylinositol glycan class A protein
MANGLKMYHLQLLPLINGTVGFPSFLNGIPIVREVLLREKIDVVHGHFSTSVSMTMVMMAAKALGVKTVITEHTLFPFGTLETVHLNKLCKWYLKDVDAAIGVSHACKDNFVLRAKIDPNICFTIPNAVDTSKFHPNPSLRYPLNKIIIVFVARLTARKGVDFLIDIIPEVLNKCPNAHFIIGGDGDKTPLLKELVKKYGYEDCVELVGALKQDDVPKVLQRGHIFLNTSLTESFCLSMLEAASCGLLVVSTDVGGIPEVLPAGVAYLATPDAPSLSKQLFRAM